MTETQSTAQRQLERLIFDNDRPEAWVQDVWDMNPILGERAAKLLDAFNALAKSCAPQHLEQVTQSLSSDLVAEENLSGTE